MLNYNVCHIQCTCTSYCIVVLLFHIDKYIYLVRLGKDIKFNIVKVSLQIIIMFVSN